MPRKNRSTALALALVLLLGLAGQAAMARPLQRHAAVNNTNAGDFLAAAWAWFTAQWSGLGQVVAAPARAVTGASPTGSGGSDPNGGGSNCLLPGPGTPP
jgi:opacity protein-like surface antigen